MLWLRPTYFAVPLVILLGMSFGMPMARGNSSEEALIRELATSKAWLNLLYYDKKGSGYQSVVTHPQFFINRKSGSRDPLQELRDTVQTFNQDFPLNNNHPQCLYPSRYLLLRRKFKLKEPVPCPQFQQWLGQYAPEEVMIVYASQYISNPASIFGHSFLLLPSTRQTKAFWLTFNYAATVPADTNGAAYVYGGLTGWYSGDYSVMPFYHRIFQYGSIENRDLWLYKIKMTPEEFEFFLKHMWELVHASRFTYYFMDANCAGILMRTFAATLPDMREANELPVYVAPVEAIKALARAGRIEEVDLVPSESNVLRADLKTLDAKQRRIFQEAIENPKRELPTVDAGVAETLMQYVAYQTRKNSGEIPEELKAIDRSAHIQRSRFATPPIPYPTSELLHESAHLSHDSSALQVGTSSLNNEGVFNFGYRFAIHGLLDPDAGYLKNSSVEFMNLNLSAKQDALWWRDLTIAQMENFQALQFFDPQPSWRVKVAVVENLLTKNPADQFTQVRLGYGAGTDWNKWFFYTLLASDLNFGKDLPQARAELGPEVGAILDWQIVKGFVSVYSAQSLKVTSGLRWSLAKNLSLIQSNEWVCLSEKKIEGSRVSFDMRYYY